MTQIAFIGNTTSEAELRYTQAGKAVASVTVAVNRKRGDQEETDFHRVTIWEGMAENAATLPKGTRVVVIGRLVSRAYETREGEKRTGWEVTADGFGPDMRFASVAVTRSDRPAQAADTSWPTAQVAAPAGGDTDVPF
jgi:single-strand DNA-binding protein